MIYIQRRIILTTVLALVFGSPVLAQIKLPRLISDGMILQQQTETRIWGWASPGEVVTIDFKGRTYTVSTDEEGNWGLTFEPMSAGGPHSLSLSASNEVVISDIYFGEVWLASGQSNIELPMRRVLPLYEADIAASENPLIRMFNVPIRYDFKSPQSDLPGGSWVSANPETVLDFSAVGYFFAKEIHETQGVPVGIILSGLGGSPAEAWMSEEALKSFPNHLNEAIRFRDDNLIREIEQSDRDRSRAWYELLASKDAGYADPAETWHNPETDLSDWKSMSIPGYWRDTETGAVNGSVWFRKDIELPSEYHGKAAFLELGRIVDSDSVFINGTFVGNVTYQYPPRWYPVPENILKAGKNTLVVRVVNESGNGGFIPDRKYELRFEDRTFDLTGDWHYRLGARMDPLGSQTFIRWKPLGLFNAMISPLLNYTIRGAIWYQGESNTGRPVEYRSLFPAMISDWRGHWGLGDFPFLFVQLASYMEANETPVESNWAMLREAQAMTLSVPNTAMAVAIDIGEWNDIHPLNKKDVGVRLSLGARKLAYGENIVHSGPQMLSWEADGNKIRIHFEHTGTGLQSIDGEALRHFSIAGADKVFVWANAVIDGNSVVVWSDAVPNPAAVRYAWSNNPDGANLFNSEELPASPFRTDSW